MVQPVILVFTRKEKTRQFLLEQFRKLPFGKIVQIHNDNDRTFKIKRFFAKRRWLNTETILFLTGLLIAFSFYHQLWLAASLLIGFLIISHLLMIPIENRMKHKDPLLRRYQSLVMAGETLTLIECDPIVFEKIIKIIQRVKDEPIAFFSSIDKKTVTDISSPELLPHPAETQGELERQARELATVSLKTSYECSLCKNFLSHMNALAAIYRQSYKQLSNLASYNENIQLSAEWLLDNANIVKQSITDVQKNLPISFFSELPFLLEGPFYGTPGLYPLVARLVSLSDGKMTAENITAFLNAYQEIKPLTIGDLWAFPLVLKVRLLECLVHLTTRIVERVNDSQSADFWANRILYATRINPDKTYKVLSLLAEEIPSPSTYFADQLMIQLTDTEAANTVLFGWLQRKVGSNLPDMIRAEQAKQTLEQTSIANVISSLRRLEQMDWREIFANTSIVEKILSQDAARIYSNMDFSTKDYYRHVVEKLAKLKKISEVEVASMAVNLGAHQQTILKQHVGYYLIDEGKPHLEQQIGLSKSVGRSFFKILKENRTFLYLSSVALFTLGAAIIFTLLFSLNGISWSTRILLFLLSLIPFSELILQILNYTIAHLIQPNILPKMLYEKGVPESYKTLVVVPTLFSSEESVHRELEKIEIHFLANSDPHIAFGILSDFPDHTQEESFNDVHLLQLAKDGLHLLNKKYLGHNFYLFHRKRRFNAEENCWMGWERKRGKIENLNCFLSGVQDEGLDQFLQAGDASYLATIKYILTADSDTQLPKNSVRRLVEALSHPLNQGYIDEESKTIQRGYTLIQPRVSTSYLSSKATWFAELFSDPSGIDPYTKSSSDIYQDLFDEGVYHGKGLYDTQLFHKVLSNRLPENQILSHDLLEGAYVRVAFASDIEFYDSFPETYALFAKRQHRWVRGDWQLLNWLGRTVPSQGSREVNPLSAINRWKIFDNLRRSILPIASLMILFISWLTPVFLPWTLLILSVTALPILLRLVDLFWITLKTRLTHVWGQLSSGLLKTIPWFSFLPHQAFINLDAILKALYRQYYSRTHLLQWTVSSSFSKEDQKHCSLQLGGIAIGSLVFSYFLILFFPTGLALKLPILILWILSPVICRLLNTPYLKSDIAPLPAHSEAYIRLLSRKTWRYFDDFVTKESNYLPPDNYQEKLKIEVAFRTSPTNIGLYMMSAASAHRFGYLTLDTLIQRFLDTLHSLKSLERYKGHFLNWYDIKNISPLLPKYVSTVDSGNLLGCLWAIESMLQGVFKQSTLDIPNTILSIHDLLQLFHEALHHQRTKASSLEFRKLNLLAKNLRKTPYEFKQDVAILKQAVRQELDLLYQTTSSPEAIYWLQKLNDYLKEIESWIQQTAPWLQFFENPISTQIASLHREGLNWIQSAKLQTSTFQDLLMRNVEGIIPLLGWLQALPISKLDEEGARWAQEFINSVNQSFLFAEELKRKTDTILQVLQELSSEMNLAFLYNNERKLFSIGYNVTDRRLDSSCYDLLASEARLASFIAIAKNDVPLEHWWALGRPTTEAFGMIVLQSWGGTMFEYLMPVIWCKNFDGTLLDYACKTAVQCQIAYGNQLGIPWGISESAYSRLDIHNIYQYRAFGVPYLGIKKGLENDFVITPYSSALALMINPTAAVKNLKRLDQTGILSGPYGFFEAIDYSREYQEDNERGIVIHTYMAHHLGMSLTSFCNVLYQGYIQELFHTHPRVKALETILYERPDISSGKISGRTQEQPFPKLAVTANPAGSTHFDSPLTPIPVTHLLSNGSYTVMVTNSGGGYSKYQNLDITRWRVDATCDKCGSAFYIRDTERNAQFSTASFPAGNSPNASYSVNFSNHKVEITKRDLAIEALSEIAVSSEDNVEVRCITLSNLAMRYRQLEITSYVEIALAEHKADLIHPAFSKMFIETEAIPEYGGLIAHRRPRSPNDPERWCFHIATTDGLPNNQFSFETQRDAFIGNSRSLANPDKLSQPLSNTQGYVLDPIFSLRKNIRMEAGKQIKVSFVTGYANSREEALKLLEKYRHLEASLRILEMAWTHAELDLRRLHITHDDAHIFQRLANFMIYPDVQLRASAETLKANRFGQDKLWGHGISGDNPILLVTIEDLYNLDIVRSTLLAHAFWSLRGLKADLVILNKEKTSYEQPLNEHLIRLMQAFAQYTGLNSNGGIFLLEADKLANEDLILIYTVAHAVIVAERGSLSQQLASPRKTTPLQSLLKTDPNIPEQPSPPLPFLELLFYNGIGGFSQDGKEYAIFYEKGSSNPAPWINVICNKNFGFLASARGLGMTWNQNSQMNRLTPWSNDSTLNPIVDICYIRDDETGKFWSVTASPILENDPFRARHGHGYTVYEHNSHAIEQELTVFVPLDDSHTPVRVQILKLINHSSRKRKLSIFTYTELTLGQEREESQRYIESSWNFETNSLMAVNLYRPQFADYVSFMSSSLQPTSFTGSRKDFIGRNQTNVTPDALKRSKLSQRVGVAMDPCFALHTTIELYPNETSETVTILGECVHIAKAKEICHHYKDINRAHAALHQTKTWWDQLLNKVQIQTPEKSIDLLFNRWLTYQNLGCRMWARSAFYQSGGAYGFRDQLQDSAALVYADPSITREHIIRCAGRQFLEGDVQHWWHVESGSGVRTRISDDLLWLPYVVLHYIQVTGDESIMEIEVPYLEGRLLEDHEHEAIVIPTISEKKGTIKEHCLKTIERSLATGPHGLPLIGGGDWNDGMNLVGIDGKGESVWLAWFMIFILKEFQSWLQKKGDLSNADHLAQHAARILEAIETNAWDGSWYLRAFFDDGTPVGSHTCNEDKIDSLSQSWAAINGIETERVASAMEAVERYLVDEPHKLVLLFTPPFDRAKESPGYIKGYPPGVRENGGQYTHAAVWVAMAFAKRGEGDKAMHILQMINPINHAKTPEELKLYRVEPYVMAADIYALEGDKGRGGWTWYTGSASLMYRTILEDVIGFKLQGDFLVMDPVLPRHWDEFTLNYRHGEALYEIQVMNPQHVSKGVVAVELDQQALPDKKIPLIRAAGKHAVKIVLG